MHRNSSRLDSSQRIASHMIRVAYIVGKGKLVPESFEALAQLDKMQLGERVHVEIYRERNLTFSNMVYLRCNELGAAMRLRARNVRGWLATRTGRCDLITWPPKDRLPKDHIVNPLVIPWGTGPSDMNQVELESFWDDAREIIRTQIMPYVDSNAATELSRWL